MAGHRLPPGWRRRASTSRCHVRTTWPRAARPEPNSGTGWLMGGESTAAEESGVRLGATSATTFPVGALQTGVRRDGKTGSRTRPQRAGVALACAERRPGTFSRRRRPGMCWAVTARPFLAVHCRSAGPPWVLGCSNRGLALRPLEPRERRGVPPMLPSAVQRDFSTAVHAGTSRVRRPFVVGTVCYANVIARRSGVLRGGDPMVHARLSSSATAWIRRLGRHWSGSDTCQSIGDAASLLRDPSVLT